MNDLDVTKAMEPKSDQLNADDFLTGARDVRIASVDVDNTRDKKVWIYIEGETKKPWKPSVTYLRVIYVIWGTPNAALWIGRELTLYRDPEIHFGPEKVGGIAISNMDGIERPTAVSVTKTRGKKQTIIIKPFISKDAPKIDVEAVQADALAAASKGKDAFTKWWRENPSTRKLVKPIEADLKAATVKADAPAPEPADAPTEGNDNDPAI
jgi:hypothetical protein